jgi:hypothetical protein
LVFCHDIPSIKTNYIPAYLIQSTKSQTALFFASTSKKSGLQDFSNRHVVALNDLRLIIVRISNLKSVKQYLD